MRHERAAIHTVRAAYDIHSSHSAWAENIIGSATPCFDHDFNPVLLSMRIASSDPELPFLTEESTSKKPSSGAILRMSRLLTLRDRVTLVPDRPTATSTATDLRPALREIMSEHGIQEFASIRARDRDLGLCLVFPSGTSLEEQPSQVSSLWGEVAAHMMCGFRLRQARRGTTSDGAYDALLSEDGRLLDVSPQAVPIVGEQRFRRSLVEAHELQTRHGGSLEPDEALTAWGKLVRGDWILLESFDQGGRRYFVAHANPIRKRNLLSLSSIEHRVIREVARGASNKEIAFELRLHPSTVSRCIRGALDKLGLVSRIQVVHLARLLSPDATTKP